MDKNQLAQDILESVGPESPDTYFNQVRDSIKQASASAGRKLTDEEDRKMQDGFAVDEMMKSAGWAVVQDILTGLSLHTWVDPRGMKKEDWEFAELNAFHASNNAKELLEGLSQLVQQAHELHRIKLGQTAEVKKMRI